MKNKKRIIVIIILVIIISISGLLIWYYPTKKVSKEKPVIITNEEKMAIETATNNSIDKDKTFKVKSSNKQKDGTYKIILIDVKTKLNLTFIVDVKTKIVFQQFTTSSSGGMKEGK